MYVYMYICAWVTHRHTRTHRSTEKSTNQSSHRGHNTDSKAIRDGQLANNERRGASGASGRF